ncbi:MAG: HEAT repeat domain-containing protein [Candidatus Rokubacteria bacterium]|nr:HEAT repeat domain-containing protein [Candidatus Rokubacteria bacterium]
MDEGTRRRALFVVLTILGAFGWVETGQAQADVNALLRDAASPDFERAHAAVQALAKHPDQRARVVPALITLLATPEWKRCSGEMRQALATTLVTLQAREAVPALLELVKSGKPIEHECFE